MWIHVFAKAAHILFFSKNTYEIDILRTRIINILTTNEQVMVTVRRTVYKMKTSDNYAN